MPDSAEIVIFDLSGRTRDPRPENLVQRIARIRRAPRGSKVPATPPGSRGGDGEDSLEAALLKNMNEDADGLARELEAEILAALPPDSTVSVRAELRFQKGSLVMIGTVAVLSWAGSVVLETVRSELGAIIKIATQRVIAAALTQFSSLPATMECSVKPRPRSASSAMPTVAPALPPVWPGGINWRDIVLIFLTLAVLFLLFNNVFDVNLRNAAPTAAAPATMPAQR